MRSPEIPMELIRLDLGQGFSKHQFLLKLIFPITIWNTAHFPSALIYIATAQELGPLQTVLLV